MNTQQNYFDLNAELSLRDANGNINFESDKEAARQYFLQHVNMNTVFFHSLEEKLKYLFEEGYYRKDIFDQYSAKFVKNLYKKAYDKKFRFQNFMGAYKFYTSYAMKTIDNTKYLERYEDRVVVVALTLGKGDEQLATEVMEEIISGRYQPATPTFLNSGKIRAGEPVSCFPAGTLIDTINGQKPINEIEIGEKVLTEDGTYRNVIATNKRIFDGKLLKIKIVGAPEIYTTPEHPFLTYVDGNDTREDTHGGYNSQHFKWIAAKNLKANFDQVVNTNIKDNKFENKPLALIQSITEEDNNFNDYVYNIQVEGNPTYSVNGIIVHNCFLINCFDSMESISRTITNALQLSKRGGGVGINLSNLREEGAPIKNIENMSSGVVPVMKILEDSFSYANQLGARQGAGVVYLNVHHPDILKFLDTKRENADEKIRIKTLSIGLVVPDITMQLASKNENMYLFSPYDVQREYGVPFSEISITEKYDEMVENKNIRKKKISARELLKTIATIQTESGYPYLLFEDNANRQNTGGGRINMSNLCVDGDSMVEISSDQNGNNNVSISIQELSELLKNGLSHNLFVRTYDTFIGGQIWKQIDGVHGKGMVDELIEIVSESGKTVRVTYDHEIYTHNRGWVKAQDLLETDILETI